MFKWLTSHFPCKSTYSYLGTQALSILGLHHPQEPLCLASREEVCVGIIRSFMGHCLETHTTFTHIQLARS
jgi:hypothetical protein